MINNFTCENKRLTIRGAYFLKNEPKAGEKYPVLICSHGFTGNYRDNFFFCEKFSEEGYLCVTFGFCGGGSIYNKDEMTSDGDSVDLSISSEVSDLEAVIDYVNTLPFADMSDVSLMGFSQGGFVSGVTAGKLGDKIKRLIMVFPALCIPDHARRGMLGGGNYDPENVPDEIKLDATTIGKTFHNDVVDMDAYLEIGKYKGPVLLIQGTRDFIVNSSYAIRAKHEFKDACQLLIVRGMPHGFDEWQMQSIVDNVRQFFDGKKEVFSFRIILTHTEENKVGDEIHRDIYFTGYCESDIFAGSILPGAVDHQVVDKDGNTTLHAVYSFDGTDSDGNRCRIDVDNKLKGRDYMPVIKTDSKALAWMNNTEFTAVVESGEGGPTIRIYK